MQVKLTLNVQFGTIAECEEFAGALDSGEQEPVFLPNIGRFDNLAINSGKSGKLSTGVRFIILKFRLNDLILHNAAIDRVKRANLDACSRAYNRHPYRAGGTS